MAVASAYGHGCEALLQGVLSGKPAFAPVSRFDVSARRVGVAATLPETPSLRSLLTEVIAEACAGEPVENLHLAIHGEPARDHFAGQLFRQARTYTSACVAASQAMADAAASIAHGIASRAVVAAGYLVEPDQFALFDAGRALAADGRVRPFSAGRTGLLLGDGVAAVVLESGIALRRRGAEPRGWLRGWARSGDAHHVCQPRPDGAGLARAIDGALARGGVPAGAVGYVNAHGSGSTLSDAA